MATIGRTADHELRGRHGRGGDDALLTNSAATVAAPATARAATADGDGTTRLRAFLRRIRDEGAPLAVVGVLVAAYVVVFGWLTWQQHRNYGTFGFDMGIHDQGIWLLSRFEDPYVTVVGRDYLGHHLNLVAFLYVPFYWLGAGPSFLYLTETIALALGAVPVYLLARDQIGGRWCGTAFAAAFLLHPTVQWINWWHFHPDALMVTPLLFAWWFATRRRWLAFAVCCALAIVAKEDATTAVVMMGLILTVRHWRDDRRIGLLTIGGGAAWFLLGTKVLMPYFNNGELAFYEDFFPGLGDNLGDIVRNAITHPSRWYDPILGRSTSSGSRAPAHVEAFRDDVYRYYSRLLAPMCIVALRKPTLLLIGVPMLVINVLSSLSYTHDARFHYSAIIVVAIVLASIEGTAAMANRARRTDRSVVAGTLVGAVLACAVITNVMWSPSPLNHDVHTNGTWARPWLRDAPAKTAARDRMLDLVPSDAGVSATYALIPHLTHREIAYEFPNPWWVTNWLDCKTSPQPDRVDLLVVDTAVLADTDRAPFGMSSKELFDELIDPVDGEFAVIGRDAGVVVAERVRPAELSFDNPRPRCDR